LLLKSELLFIISPTRVEGYSKTPPLTNHDINDFKFKGLLTLADDINLKIIEELVKNPSTSSMSLATKLGMPLSSLQRRRTKLERSLLIKAYHIDLKASGAKMGDIVVNVDKGK